MESSVELSMLHRCFWPSKGYRLIQVLSCILLCLAMCGPCATRNHLVSCADGWWDSLDYDACRSYTDNDAGLQDLLFGDASSIYIQRNSPGLSSIKSVCTHSDLFCFPSTLPGFLSEDDDNGEAQNSNDSTSTEVSVLHKTRESNSSWNADHATFTLSNGRLISCSLNSAWEPRDKLPPLDNNFDQNGLDSCKGPSLPNVSVQKPSPPTSISDKNPKAVTSDLFNSSSSLHVSISPPLLDWGLNHLYVPSLAFLTVANTCNDTILHVHEPFSTDPQFYTYDFEEMFLAPGEASTIAFVFLPRWLGSSSSHLILQTSSGGFLINTKGVAIESPYGIQPLVGLDISSDGRLRKNLSLYNPFDDSLFVEEIAAWIAVTTDNTSHYAHTVCSVDTSHASDQFSSSLNVKEWLNVKSEMGLRLMGIRPYGQWEVGSHNTETIIEVDMLSHVEGKAFGAFCMQLRSSSCDRTDTVIVPLEAEVHGRVAYKSFTGSVSVFLETAMACNDKGLIAVTLSLRNSASYILSLVKISEVTENAELFQVKYMEGLVIFPGTDTRIAVVIYAPPHDLQDPPIGIPSISLNCRLLIVTNDSRDPHIEIPCLDLVRGCSRLQSDSAFTAAGSSYIGLDFQQEKEELTRAGSLGSIIQEPPPIKWKVSDIAEADELILTNWRSQGTSSGMSVLEDDELLFPMVQVGTHCSEWISVTNPSGEPVVMQLVLNSGLIIDQCRADDELLQHPISSSFVRNDSVSTKDGFFIAETAITEAYVHPYSRAFLGPIVFRPSNRCLWQSSALIRNNLSGVEWLPLRGFGGSLSLVLLEGSEPIQHLEFNLEVPIPLNMSPTDLQSSSSACVQPLSKELFAKNTGDLPLEVFVLNPKQDLHGLGFDPFKHAPEFRERKRLRASGNKELWHRKAASAKANLFTSNSGKLAPGFGIGALEELDVEDEDIYASGFDFEETYVEEDEEPSQSNRDKKQHLGKKEAGVLSGFKVASNSEYQLERFNPPVIPPDFEPHHKFPAPLEIENKYSEPPPPEVSPPEDNNLRLLIEGFATLVTRCGKLFEDLSREKNKSNPLFSFLNGGDGHDFYARKLWEGQQKHTDQRKLQLDVKSKPSMKKMTAETRGRILAERPLERSSKDSSSSVASTDVIHLQYNLSETFTNPTSLVETLEAAKPFKNEPAKQERFEQFLKDKYQGGLRSTYTSGNSHMSENDRARERLDFEAAAEAIEKGKRSMATDPPANQQFMELLATGKGQFVSGGIEQNEVPQNEEKAKKRYPQREEYQWRPAPILCKRFDIIDPFMGKPPAPPRARSKMDSLIFIPDLVKTTKTEESAAAAGREPLPVSQSEEQEVTEQVLSKETEIEPNNASVQRPVDLYKAIFSDDSDDEEENTNINQADDAEKKTEGVSTTLNRMIAGDFLESLGKELGLEVPTDSLFSLDRGKTSAPQKESASTADIKISSGNDRSIPTLKTSNKLVEVKEATDGEQGASSSKPFEREIDKAVASVDGNGLNNDNPRNRTPSMPSWTKATDGGHLEHKVGKSRPEKTDPDDRRPEKMDLDDKKHRKHSRRRRSSSSGSSLSDSDSSDDSRYRDRSRSKEEKRRKSRKHSKHRSHKSKESPTRTSHHGSGRDYKEERREKRRSRDKERESGSSRSEARRKHH